MTQATRVVRKVMQQFGKGMIYTNKYKNCRTVKCYAGDGASDKGMLVKIFEALDRNGLGKYATSKRIERKSNGWRYTSSIIVRLPL